MTQDGSCCVLVVEDNPGDVQRLRYAFNDAGLSCELFIMRDGLEALLWARMESPNSDINPRLAILDLNLPKHGGVEILEAMQGTARASVPVLVLSSSPSPRDITRVMAFPNAKLMTSP